MSEAGRVKHKRFIADLWEAAKVTRASSSGPILRICRRFEAESSQTRPDQDGLVAIDTLFPTNPR